MPLPCIFDFTKFAVLLFVESSGSSSVGRASASQAEGRGFEPHFPLNLPPFSAQEGFIV